jgi:hypothetical protein
MKSNVGGIRLKLGTAVDSQPAAQLPYDQQKTGHVGARVLATRIAAHTVKVLLEGEMLDSGFRLRPVAKLRKQPGEGA